MTEQEAEEKALPCPFCGGSAKTYKIWAPSAVEICCKNDKCLIRPAYYEIVECVENKGDTPTFTPLFDKHWGHALEKWNTRILIN